MAENALRRILVRLSATSGVFASGLSLIWDFGIYGTLIWISAPMAMPFGQFFSPVGQRICCSGIIPEFDKYASASRDLANEHEILAYLSAKDHDET